MNDNFAALALPARPATGPAFADGDVALILKADGSVNVLTVGMAISKERAQLPKELLTDHERFMVEQGEKMMALWFAANTPQIMDMLIDMVTDPEIVNHEEMRNLGTLN